MGRQAELEELLEIGQAAAQGFPVAFASFDECRELLELLATDGGLGIEWLQIKTEMAVDVFVIVALGQLTELPAEALVARIVLPARAPAVATPVAETLGVRLERRSSNDAHRATLAHGEMVGWIE